MKEVRLCEYGCGQEGLFLLKNGKWCCCKNYQSCSEVKRKNSKNKIGITPKWKKGPPRGFLGKIPWNKGLTKEIDDRCALSEETKKKLVGRSGKASTYEKEIIRIQKIKETAKLNKIIGGKRERSGRGKKGWYKGYWCDSSWELAYVIYNIEHNLKFIRNRQGFEYEYLGEKHKFYPDFILEDGVYVEIKGYLDEKNKVKISSFQGCLTVLGKNEIRLYLDYVIQKYGKDFISLYEKVG